MSLRPSDPAAQRSIIDSFLRAANTLYAQRHQHAPAIAASAGLSVDGALLGFEALERTCSSEEAASLVRAVPQAHTAYVLLSANVFVAPFRALLLARLGASRVVVRPSSRDPYFAGALVQALADDNIALDAELTLPREGPGMVHLYGSDETLAAVRAQTRMPVWGHGTGFGAAYVAAHEITAGVAQQLALDVTVFDQRGCLSPKVIFVEDAEPGAPALALLLHQALAGSPVPRGELHPSERSQITHFVDTMRMAGDVHLGDAHVVAVAPPGATVLLPPVGRTVLVVPVQAASDVPTLLAPMNRFVTTLGVSHAAAREQFGLAFPRARLSPLGAMQRPPLDGPVDLRTPEPLAGS